MRKKFRKKIILIVFFIFGLTACASVHEEGGEGQRNIYDEESEQIPSVVPEDTGNWVQSSPLIAHAGGGVDRADYTNSQEAFALSAENGFHVIEADFLLTNDDEVILCHDWEGVVPARDPRWLEGMTYAEFIGEGYKLKYKFTPMDVSGVVEFMKEHEDVYIVTDMKFDEDDKSEIFLKIFSEIYQKTEGNEELLNRFIVQVYDEESCELISSVYDFPEKIYTLYHYKDYDYEKAALVCLKYGIPVLTAPQSSAPDNEEIEMLHSKGIKIYLHTINNLIAAENWFDRGGDGIYTDWIIPDDLELINR